jgi:uncharacterized protein
MKTITTPETIFVDGIPIHHFEPKESQFQFVPTVFIYHGWFSSKESYSFVGEILGAYGFRVIVPDAPLHGKRQAERNLQRDFWNVIIQSVDEFELLAHFAEERWGISPADIAVVGSSMGGFAAAGIFAEYTSLKCLVSINGSGAWEISEQVFRQMDGRPPATLHELTEIRQFDPLHKIGHLPTRPILLQHGDSDSIIPIDGQREFYRQLVSHYGERYAHLVKFQEIPRMNHYMSLGMFEDVVGWLFTHFTN